MNRRNFLNWVSLGFIASVFPEIASLILPNNKLLTKAVIAQPVLTTDEVIKKIQNIYFSELGRIYHRPNDQDREGRGILPCYGENNNNPDINVWGDEIENPKCKKIDNRSETVYLPFAMAPRRQTDSMIRQAYFLLSENIRRNTAFLIADRLVQYPEYYIPYIQSKENVVLIGSFQGLDQGVKNEAEYQAIVWLKELHDLQFKQLDYSIDLIKSLNKNIVDVVYAMGDSSDPHAGQKRKEITEQFNTILKQKGLEHFALKKDALVAWGADETILKAFARQLPEINLKIEISNPDAIMSYEGGERAKKVVDQVIENLKINEIKDNNFDAQALIFTWYSKDYSFTYENKTKYGKDENQEKSDKDLIKKMKSLSIDEQKKTIIVDTRMPNGAWNTSTIPSSDKFLAFGAWGTPGNSFGQTLAIAKLLHFYNQPNKAAIQRQLLLEAIAHDTFLIGYQEGQNPTGYLQIELKKKGLTYNYTKPYYTSAEETQKVFQVINQVVNKQIKANGRQESLDLKDTKFTFVPQLWRTFESQVFINDGPLSIAGVYVKTLTPETFNPTVAVKNVKKFNKEELINEFK